MESVDTVRKLLGVWGRSEMRIAELQDELQTMRKRVDESRDVIRAAQINGMPRTGAKKDLSDTIISLERIDESFRRFLDHLANELDDLVRVKMQMDTLINDMPCRYQRILEMRYKRGMTYLQIAWAANYSHEHVRRLEMEAVRMLAKQIQIEDNQCHT